MSVNFWTAQPFEAYVYNVFWIRFANHLFTLNNLDDYETHFTVMNYTPGATLTQVSCEEFIEKFESHYDTPWSEVRDRINKAMGATLRAPAKAIAFPRSVALYGFDVMLTEELLPQILECNFSPDCNRACKYHPHFVRYISCDWLCCWYLCLVQRCVYAAVHGRGRCRNHCGSDPHLDAGIFRGAINKRAFFARVICYSYFAYKYHVLLHWLNHSFIHLFTFLWVRPTEKPLASLWPVA